MGWVLDFVRGIAAATGTPEPRTTAAALGVAGLRVQKL